MAGGADGSGEADGRAEAGQGRAVQQPGDTTLRIGAAVAGDDESSGDSEGLRCWNDEGWTAVLCDGVCRRPVDHAILRRKKTERSRSAGIIHPGVRRSAAPAPEANKTPGFQALERASVSIP